MPILSKLSKNLGEMKEVKALEEWADSLLEGGDGGEASEETDGDTSGTAGEGGAEDNPLDEAAGAETLAHNQATEKSRLDAFDLDETEDAEAAHKKSQVPAFMRKQSGDPDWKTTTKDLEKAKERNISGKEGLAALAKRLDQIDEQEVEESGLQAYLGNKKYGKEGMDALRKAGRDGASKEKMAQIRAKYDKMDEGEVTHTSTGLKHRATDKYGAGEDPDVAHPRDAKDLNRLDKNRIKSLDASMGIKWKNKGPKGLEVDEGLDADQKRVGQLGPTEKVGPKGAVGKLVGANESVEFDELAELKRLLGK
jgi:hypothetical protein